MGKMGKTRKGVRESAAVILLYESIEIIDCFHSLVPSKPEAAWGIPLVGASPTYQVF